MNPQNLSPVGKNLFGLIEFDKDERLIWEIRKHPLGLMIIYLTGLFVTATLLVVTLLGSAWMDAGSADMNMELGVDASSFRPVVILVGLILTVMSIVITFIAAYLYKGNVVLVTSDKLAQVLNPALFNRKISQLSIGDVQDITVTKRGILAHIFDYGTLVVETAGEQQNYTFTYVPQPYEVSKAIVGAHEENLKLYGN